MKRRRAAIANLAARIVRSKQMDVAIQKFFESQSVLADKACRRVSNDLSAATVEIGDIDYPHRASSARCYLGNKLVAIVSFAKETDMIGVLRSDTGLVTFLTFAPIRSHSPAKETKGSVSDVHGYTSQEAYLISHSQVRWEILTDCTSDAHANYGVEKSGQRPTYGAPDCIAAYEAQRAVDRRLTPAERAAIDAELARYVRATQRVRGIREGVEPPSVYPVGPHSKT